MVLIVAVLCTSTPIFEKSGMNLREQMEQIYRDIPLDSIPWISSEPPGLLVRAVETGKVKPCKAVDLGCGAGHYAVWLAQQSFDVIGIDISRHAIKHAADLAARKGVSCRFVVGDLLGDVKKYYASFEFAYDWELLHHIFPEDRPHYVKNVHNLLRPNGKYFSLCFSERDAEFGGKGKYRRTPLGTTLYFSSEEELRELFEPFFHILELSTLEIPGKHKPHMANAVWLERRRRQNRKSQNDLAFSQ
jgi:SAM-dependent methyltransferase